MARIGLLFGRIGKDVRVEYGPKEQREWMGVDEKGAEREEEEEVEEVEEE